MFFCWWLFQVVFLSLFCMVCCARTFSNFHTDSQRVVHNSFWFITSTTSSIGLFQSWVSCHVFFSKHYDSDDDDWWLSVSMLQIHTESLGILPKAPLVKQRFFFFGGGVAVVNCPKLGDVTVLRPKVLEDEQNLQDDRHQVASKMERYRPIDYIYI